MYSQLELVPPAAPEVDAAEVEFLLRLLEGRDWQTARAVAALPEWQRRFPTLNAANAERRVRALASASGGRVLSCPGSPGYKLTREATIAEIQGATTRLRHQAGEMTGRAVEIDRVYHGKARG